MKKFKTGLGTALVVIMLFAIAACASACQPKIQFSFVTNSDQVIKTVELKKGEEYTLPIPEDKAGHRFVGWYLNAEFTGDRVEKMTAEKNTKFYASWDKVYTVSLNLDGGSLGTTTPIQLKAGDNIYDAVKDFVPTKTDYIFGAWFNGDTQLSTSAVMPEENITLTAKYKIRYTVERYFQTIAGDSYEKDADDVTDYDYVGVTVRPTGAVEGFDQQLNHESAINSKTLTEVVADNVLKLYYARKDCRIAFAINYPDNTVVDEEIVTAKYGEEVQVPSQYEAEGYYLLGWSTSTEGEVLYKANYIDSVIYNNTEAPRPAEKFTAERSVTLYGIWNKGYVDMFGSDDFVYFDETEDDLVYLSRAGIFFKGIYYTEENEFIFSDSNGKTLLKGKLIGEGVYAYSDLERLNSSRTLYVSGVGLDNNINIYFDAYNGITYGVKDENGIVTTSEGTYTIDEDEIYTAVFTSGALNGETLTFICGTAGTVPAFQLRIESEAAFGWMVRYVIVDSEVKYYTGAYQMAMSGFGIAYMNTGTQIASYAYTYNSDLEEIRLSNPSTGQLSGIARIVRFGDSVGYMLYDGNTDHTFTAESGATLTMDGLYNATYTDGNTTVSGYYSASTSVFGGMIVTFVFDDELYTFLTTTTVTEVEGEDGEIEKVYTYSFERKANGYIEYYYQDSEGVYYAPLLVINDTEAGQASLYGYTAAKTYEKVSSGTYQYNEETKRYVYTAVTYYEAPNVSNALYNLSELKSFVFALDSTTTSYKVSYWYSSTNKDDETVENEVKEYTGNGDEKLALVAGFAFLTKEDGTSVVGTYATKNGLTTITVKDGQNEYLILDEEAGTFELLADMPYASKLVNEDGTANNDRTLSFDGRGNAVYKVVTIGEDEGKTTVEHTGVITETGEVTFSERDVLLFTADDITFKFIEIFTNQGNFFLIYNETYNGSYTSGDATLTLDNYGYMARFNNGTETIEGIYRIPSENVIEFIKEDNTTLYFDVEGRTFTLRNEEYGAYLLIDNQTFFGTYVEMDGYGNLKIYTIVLNEEEEPEIEYIDENGTYTLAGDVYTLVYQNGNETITLTVKRSTFAVDTTLYRALKIIHKEVERLFVNELDYSILVLDDIGNATRYSKEGIKEVGNYTLITDELLYFIKSDASDACIYKYDNAKATATPTTFDPIAYYTQDLDSMQFSKFGFVIFNGTTGAYYNIGQDEVVTIYRLALENEAANEYGFVAENFGTFDQEKEYEDKTYYKNDGFAITFMREAESKDKYPIAIQNVEGKKPLENLVFSPAGTPTFTVNGTVMLNGQNRNCTVTRTADEMYVTIGYFRFNITLTYGGENEDGSSNSYYEVTRLRYMIGMHSYSYLNVYYMFLILMGPSYANNYPNTIGFITIVTEFDELGDAQRNYVDGAFGADSGMVDTEGNIVKINEVDYAYDEESKMYFVEFEAEDQYTYRFYFVVSNFSGLQTVGYQVYAFTRVETLTTDDGYTVEVERVISTETNLFVPGSYFSVTLSKDEQVIETDQIYLAESGDIYYIVRTKDEESGVITSTTYYIITLTEEDGGIIDPENPVVLLLESASVSVETMETLYTEDGKSFVDINAADEIVLISLEDKVYLVKTSTFVEETSTYTIELTSGKSYTVVVQDEEGSKTVEITEIVEPEEEPEDPENP